MVSQGQGQGEGEFRDGFWICQDSFAGTVARRFSDRGVLVLGGTNDSCADEPDLKVELLKCSRSFGRGRYSLFAQRLFLPHLSVNPSHRSVLDSCLRFPLVLSSSQSSHMSTHCWFVFFEPPDFFNLCKAGISWTPRNVVSFLFIYPQNKMPSSRQSSGPRRTASSGVSSLSALLLCICGLQAQVRIKVFICFTVGSHSFFCPPTVAGSYPTAGVSVRSSQCLAEVGDAEI